MKKITAVLAALMILVCGTAALAEGTTEYSDEYYGFSHPENWKREAAEDGTVILQSPDGKAYVRADILLTDLFSFTGKEEEDATFVKAVMESFAGEGTGNTQPTLLLDGTYELITAGGTERIPGTGDMAADRGSGIAGRFHGRGQHGFLYDGRQPGDRTGGYADFRAADHRPDS